MLNKIRIWLLKLFKRPLPLSVDSTRTLILKRGVLENIHRVAEADGETPKRIAEVKRQLNIVSVELSTRDDLPTSQTINLKPGVIKGKPQPTGS